MLHLNGMILCQFKAQTEPTLPEMLKSHILAEKTTAFFCGLWSCLCACCFYRSGVLHLASCSTFCRSLCSDHSFTSFISFLHMSLYLSHLFLNCYLLCLQHGRAEFSWEGINVSPVLTFSPYCGFCRSLVFILIPGLFVGMFFHRYEHLLSVSRY